MHDVLRGLIPEPAVAGALGALVSLSWIAIIIVATGFNCGSNAWILAGPAVAGLIMCTMGFALVLTGEAGLQPLLTFSYCSYHVAI